MKLQRIDESRWRIPREGKMRVDGIVYASDAMMAELRGDPSLQQVANVAHLPGILRASLAMPDIHWGYGFPIGGVAAIDADEGVISPGGVGYDINCGVRLLRTDLRRADLDGGALREVVDAALPQHPHRRRRGAARPAPVGRRPRRRAARRRRVGGRARHGLRARPRGARGERQPAAAPSRRRCRRAPASAAAAQLGTLGSGNHFVEVQHVDEIYDERRGARLRPGARPGDGDDPQRLARARPPGVHRSPQGDAGGGGAVRHRAARPPARLRAARLAGGEALPRRRWRPRPTSPSPTAR